MPRQYLGVMVSSMFRDLREHRAAPMRAIEGQELHTVEMEQDAALPDGAVVDTSLRKVQHASAYVSVISHLYGQIPESEDNPLRFVPYSLHGGLTPRGNRRSHAFVRTSRSIATRGLSSFGSAADRRGAHLESDGPLPGVTSCSLCARSGSLTS
jgi:hypothetical protein